MGKEAFSLHTLTFSLFCFKCVAHGGLESHWLRYSDQIRELKNVPGYPFSSVKLPGLGLCPQSRGLFQVTFSPGLSSASNSNTLADYFSFLHLSSLKFCDLYEGFEI